MTEKVQRILEAHQRIVDGGRRGGSSCSRKKRAAVRKNVLKAHRGVRGKKRVKKQLSLGLEVTA